MGFQSVNEIEQFNFDDCYVTEFEVSESQIDLLLEALIVRKNNSQNSNFTESYAATTGLKLSGGKIISGVKDGFKYYNADDVLIKEVPDEPLSEEQILEFPKLAVGAYLYQMEKEKEESGLYYYNMGFEFVDESDNTMGDSYRLLVSFEKAVFTWERYMNRVQQ